MPILISAAADAIPPGVGSVSGETAEYMKLIVFLAAIVAFAFVALRLWLPKLASRAGAGAGPLKVEWRLGLEPRKTLYVVRAGASYVLLAVSDAGVQFLTSLDATQMEGALQQQPDRASSGFVLPGLPRMHRRSGAGKDIQ